MILALLARGDITLTAVGLLAPHLTSQNHAALLLEAHHKSKRDVERMVACFRPQPPVPAMVRKLPPPRPTAMPDDEALAKSLDGGAIPPPMAPAARAVVAPLAPHRYKLQLTIGEETHDKLRQVQDLLRHSIPTGYPAAILDRALTLLLAETQRTKCAATERPRRMPDVSKRSRHVPATVKRAVWSRDKGQCAFVGTNGRCSERGFLEFHHIQPYAAGGETTVANIELRCRAHNNYEKDQFFGVLPSIVRERGPAYAVG